MSLGSGIIKTIIPNNDPTRISDPAGLFSPKKPKPPPPLSASPSADSDAVKAALQKAIDEARNRKGRKSTILTSSQGVDDQLGIINRPQAQSATLFGG